MPQATPTPRQELNRRLLAQTRSRIAHRIGDSDLSLNGIAAELHVSERHLQRLFSAEGSSFRAELLQARVSDAMRQLKNQPQLAISDVARQVGYQGPMHFAKAFRRCTGHSPRAWRNFCRRRRSALTLS
jgi:AraC-like DNA-binding protein